MFSTKLNKNLKPIYQNKKKNRIQTSQRIGLPSECVQLSRGLEGSIHVCQSVVLWESLTGPTPKPAAVLDRCLKKNGNRERERERGLLFALKWGFGLLREVWIFFNAPEDRRKNEFGRLQALYRRGRVSFNFLSAPWTGFGGKGKGREREVKF
jgi:hypothetical protein